MTGFKMKNKKLGIGYMGSKRKLSGEIVDHILTAHPNTKYVWDLFGGGGAISFDKLIGEKITQNTVKKSEAIMDAILEADNG